MSTSRTISRNVSRVLEELKAANDEMEEVMTTMGEVASRANILSLNSSIEAARAGEAGRGFSVVAGEIKKFADQTMEANKRGLPLLDHIQQKANEVIAIRTTDVAADTMDKLDRTLFERYADIQGWATIDTIRNCVGNRGDEVDKQSVEALMHRLLDIYKLYHDIFILDVEGTIIASANHPQSVGQQAGDSDWFQETIQSKTAVATDMYYSQTLEANTMNFAAPIFDADGNVQGVLASTFNWTVVEDVLSGIQLNDRSELYVLNGQGEVIASPIRENVHTKNVLHIPAVETLWNSEEGQGFEVEEKAIYAYCRSKGYQSYESQNWAVLVIEPV